MKKKDVIIELKSSTFAHNFNENELIHSVEYEHAWNLVKARIAVAQTWKQGEEITTPQYDTISIFGERGTGKTSFLLSILKNVKTTYDKDVQVLNVVDPTMIEEKEHIFLLIVSLIKKEVDRKLSDEECRRDTKAYENRKTWNQQLMKLAKGLPTLGNVGGDHKTSQWQDHDFIMERGLMDVLAAFSLRDEFYNLVSLALTILGKKAFVLALDDIDVEMGKGWDVLEMLRKYVNTPQIITLLSGNLKLYSLNVRRRQWDQLTINKTYDTQIDYTKLVNELEGQYLLKVLRTENRIHLQSILQLLQFGQQYIIKTFDGEVKPIKDLYKQILASFGIKGYSQQTIFRDYLLSLSVRSQIQFLKNNSIETEARTGIESIEAFLSRLYAANVDAVTASNNVNMLDIIIQDYIQRQPSTPELYLLSPSYENGDVNACLTAFTILYAESVKAHPFLIFDFFVRMGYVRNLILGFNKREREEFFTRAGLVQNMSLKNNVGLTIGYSVMNRVHKASHIELSGLAQKNKKSVENDKERIDAVVKGQANQAQAIIAYLPISILKHTYKNESAVYYSIYNLMASISEILQNSESDAETPEMRKEESIAKIKSLLLNLQQLRTYSVLTRQGDLQTRHIEEAEDWTTENVEESTLPNDDTLENLAEAIYKWKTQYEYTIPPYLIGKIATRLYYTVHKITKPTLGEQMHRIVMALLQACLIEETHEYYVRKEGKQDVTKINISNVVTQDDYLLNNLNFILNNDAISQIPFTMWMINCPLLWAFTKVDVLKGVKKETRNEAGEVVESIEPFASDYDQALNVYEMLKQVHIKNNNVDETKPKFSAAKDSIDETIRLLRENGIDIGFIMNEANSTKDVAAMIGMRGVFNRKPYSDQIDKFREKYRRMKAAAAAQPAAETPAAPEAAQPAPAAQEKTAVEEATDNEPLQG